MSASSTEVLAAPALQTTNPLPKSIDEVIARLEAIIADCKANNHRAGYFAVLYHRVTCKIKECIANKDFEDGLRMEKLDVLFANRYIAAYDAFRAGKKPTSSWHIAFETTAVNVPLVLQHLLLGINAHINLDLGIAAVETMDGGDLAGIQKDFYTINKVLSDLVDACERCMEKVNPLLKLLHLKWFHFDDMLVAFSINTARDGAWLFANEVGKKQGKAYHECIAARDQKITELAGIIAKPKGLMLRFVLQIVRFFEKKKIADVIHLLGT